MQPTKLKNTHCPYCGDEFSADGAKWTEDHVIARNFVPKGTLETSWNLHVRACEPCNNEKSDLEDDLSAISMIPDFGMDTSPKARTHAKRKIENSRSRKTQNTLKDSFEETVISGEMMPGLSASFKLVGPPQVEPERVFALS